MSYKTLYRKYRPNQFEDLIGQQHIVKTIENALVSNKMAHAYLFCGPRGTGKTSMAKLVAKAVNCLSEKERPCGKCESCIESQTGNHPDVIELDAASNNGVDQIREIVEKVKYTPIIGKYKIYIIDEVHMLSTSAFNALLKTLEEPPAYVIFILATTDPQKVLPTIISRCQRYNFTKVSNENIQKRLETILDLENVGYDQSGLALIAELAGGGMRDALSILEQCLAFDRSQVSEAVVAQLFGVASIKDKLDLLTNISNKSCKEALMQLEAMNKQGVDVKRLTKDLLVMLKEAIVYNITKEAQMITILNEEQVKNFLATTEMQFVTRAIDCFVEIEGYYHRAEEPRVYFEMALLKLMQGTQAIKPVEGLVEAAPSPTKVKSENVKPIKASEKPVETTTETVEAIISTKETTKVPTTLGAVENLSSDFLLGLLVQATKDEKEIATKSFEKIRPLKTNIRVCRFARMLDETTLFAASEDFVLVVAGYDALANEINEATMNKCIYQFAKEELGLNRVIYAITKQEQVELVNMFKEKRETNTLPPASVVNKPEVEQIVVEEEKDQTLDLLGEMFGEENITIKED